MSTFKNGAIATITAVALTAGICSPASAEEAPFKASAEFKNNKCTVKINGEDYETYETREEAKASADDLMESIEWHQKLLKEAEEIVATSTDEGILRVHRDAIKSHKANLAEYTRLHSAVRACAEGRSVSETDVEAQVLLSTADGKGLSPAGIGVVVAGVVVVVLGAIVAALPMLKPMLPAPIANMLP